MDVKIERLRAAFAASIKYCPQYQQANPDLWRDVLGGKKLEGYSKHSVLGDSFAFWFAEIFRGTGDIAEVAKEFFENYEGSAP